MRESEGSPEKWKEYLRLRTVLLQQRYGSPLDNPVSSTPISFYRSGSRVNKQNHLNDIFLYKFDNFRQVNVVIVQIYYHRKVVLYQHGKRRHQKQW